MDAQGGEKATPYVERAGATFATFATLVDEENLLGQLFGFKVVPNGILLDEQGVVRYKRFGGFDIRREDTAAVVERWAAGLDPDTATATRPEALPGAELSDSNALFREGLERFRAGDVAAAVSIWRRGLKLDPDNYVIRKQIWAVENPDRFYAGDIDTVWQREQRAKRL